RRAPGPHAATARARAPRRSLRGSPGSPRPAPGSGWTRCVQRRRSSRPPPILIPSSSRRGRLVGPQRNGGDMADSTRMILAASFTTIDGGTRGAASVGGAFPDRVGNTAVLVVRDDGKVKFIESKDWGAGRGALLGGAIGIIGGPLGILAGGTIGALTSKLRDSGFKNDQLEQLGKSLGPNNSAVVIEIASDAVDTAKKLLEPLGGQEIVVADIDSSVATL